MTASDPLPHWDLSNVYPGLESEEFKRSLVDLGLWIKELDDYMAKHRLSGEAGGDGLLAGPNLGTGPLGDVVGGYLDRMNAIQKLYATLRAYVVSFVATDSYNAAAKRLLSELQMQSVPIENQDTAFRAWLGRHPRALPTATEHNGSARKHAFYLQEALEQSRYLMSQPEERLAAELLLSGSVAWSKLQGTICSQLTVPFEREGEVETLPIPALQNLAHDPDEGVRRRAFEAEIAAWETVKEPLAAALNGVKGAAITLNGRRGRTDALHEALDTSRIDRATLDAMLGAMQASFPAFRRYLQAKAKRLGKERLAWWNLLAPTGRSERHYTWPETQALVVSNFRRFSGRLADLAQRAFEHRWLDAEPRAGKRGGAFCMGLPAVDESRILCNFDGSLDQVSTVAHELGHAFHNDCLTSKTELQSITPMTLAETASIFCETIITDAALAQASGPDEELAILETDLIGKTQVIVDITSRFHFEKEVFERRAKAELSADEFCEIMLRCQERTYGDGIDLRHRHKYMWAWKPHYYRADLSFYNYPYAFGLLFGIGLYAIYQERGPAFVPDYEALLASTGEGTAADLAARFGLNIREQAFWESSLKVIEKRIERYCAL
jgi:pepF/M3 family oligoendopeptidase